MDIKTILIVMFLINLFLGIFTLIIKQKQRYITNVSYWAIANFLIAGCYLMLGLRGIIPDLFSIVIANIFPFLAITFRYFGFKNLYNKIVFRNEFVLLSLFIFGMILLISYFTYFDENIYYRTIFFRTGIGLFAIYFGLLMFYSSPKEEKFVAQIASFSYFIFATLSFLYVLSWVYKPEYRDIFKPNIYNLLMYLTNILIDIVWTIALLFISNQRNFVKQIESEKRVRSLFDNSHDGIVMVNKEGKLIDFNNAYSKMLGYSREELLKTDFHKLTPEIWHDWEQKEVIEKLALDNSFSITYEKEYIHKNRVIFPIELSAFVANDIEGKSYFWAIVTDITERKKAETKIRELTQAVTQSPTTIVVADTQGTIVYVNPRFTEMTGYSEQEVIGENPRILKTDKTPPDRFKELWQTVSSGKIWKGELTNKKKNGEEYTEQALIAPVFDENQKIINYIAIKEDITEKKRLENEIVNRNEQLIELNATKDKFISILAHDLRSPFNVLIGFTHLLQNKIIAENLTSVKEFVDIIEQTSKNTYKLLENLLEWASSQQNRIAYKPETINLQLIVYECYTYVANNAVAKKIEIKMEIGENIFIQADSDMTKTILRNLMTNAIKFTPISGKIVLSAKINQTGVEISVSDTGVGMDEKTKNSLFKIGTTKSTTGTEGEHGTGFGLLLCKEFVEKHGGKIWVESEVGKGSDFKFTMPLRND